MKIALILATSVIALALIVVAAGYTLPKNHSASRERTFAANASTIYNVITSPAEYPRWRSGVKRVEMLPMRDGKVTFREVSGDGTITFVFDEAIADRRVVSRIADRDLPFGGKWTYELTPSASGTTLRITEEGEIYNPLFRVITRFFLGYHRTIDGYLDSLQRRLG